MMRDFIKQSVVMTRLNLASLSQRVWPSLIIVLSMACVIGVLLSMLAETTGLIHAYESAGSPARALVMAAEYSTEFGNSISRNDVATIESAPGIARTADGHAAADAEVLLWVPPTEGFKIRSPSLRGIGPLGLTLQPGFTVVAGRLFRSGRRELVIGIRAERAFGLKVGDTLILPDGEWPIVGAFSSGGSILEGQLVADAETLMTLAKLSGFGCVVVKLADAAAFDEFKRWLSTNPGLSVTAERQSDYYLRTAEQASAFFTALAYFVGVIMALGALFGAVKIMHTAVSTRTREIATLLAIGYRPSAGAVAIVLEMVVLSVAGGCLGAVLAWVLVNGRVRAGMQDVFDFYVSPGLILLGLGWAVGLAVLSAVPPAVRAARLSVVEALRQV
jgi:putative ABC transport system permease protein